MCVDNSTEVDSRSRKVKSMKKRWHIGSIILILLMVLTAVMVAPISAAPAVSGEEEKAQKGLFGEVVDVEVSAGVSVVTLDTREGEVEVQVSDDASINIPGRTSASVIDIVPGDFLAVHAVESEDSFEALKILVKPAKPATHKHLVGVVVEEVDGQVTVVDKEGNRATIDRPEGAQDVAPGRVIAAVVQLGQKGQIVATKKIASLREDSQEPVEPPKALGIKGSDRVTEGETATFTVFERRSGESVEGADVYAIGPSVQEILSDSSVKSSVQVLAKERGALIGTTGPDGTVSYAFDMEGGYLIVAVKADYLPGVTRLEVGPKNVLGIEAPYRAKAGEPFELVVFDKGSEEPVSGAVVYAIPGLKVGVTARQEDRPTLEANALREGELLGSTNDDGWLEATIEETGGYLLVALSSEYRPGLAHIFVVAGQVLGIKAPQQVGVGTTVALHVFDRFDGTPIVEAAVYALPGHISSIDLDSGAGPSPEVLAEWGGSLIGHTDDEGNLSYSAEQEGTFLILTTKDGYMPARTILRVSVLRELVINAPEVAQVGDEVAFTVTERHTLGPVEGAHLYAIGSWAVETNLQPVAVTPQGVVSASAQSGVPTNSTGKLTDVLRRTDQAEDGSSLEAVVEAEVYGSVNRLGVFLGETDEDGKLTHAFHRAGQYIIVAVKKDYVSARTKLEVEGESVHALGINGPEQVLVGDDATFKVFDRSAQEPVQGAGVYAFPPHLREVDISFDDDLSPEILAKWGGIFLGRTDENGKITHESKRAGVYLVLAVKNGYTPGLTKLLVRPKPVKALAIKSPSEAEVGEEVPFVVYDRSNGEAVSGAPMYAFPSNLSVILDELREEPTDDLLARWQGVFMGRTDDDGELTHTFRRAGIYVVVAVKKDYVPGVTKLMVLGESVHALGIDGPGRVEVGDDATFEVLDRNAQEPVQGAGVYAFPPHLREVDISFDDDPSAEILAKWGGIFLGRTNDDGEITHEFGRAGAYLVVAVKRGYTPGLTKLLVYPKSLETLTIKSPSEAEVGEEVPFVVYGGSDEVAVSGAAMYGFPSNLPVILNELREEPTNELLTRWQGVFMGRTDDDGGLMHAFRRAGTYVVVAVKKDYIPGVTKLMVFGESVHTLGIEGPGRVEVGDDATFKVFDRNAQEPVPSAGVYAFPSHITEADLSFDDDPSAEILAKWDGIFLGRTDEGGKVTHEFERAGAYLVVAVKKEYTPGLTKLLVYPKSLETLTIKSPSEAEVGEEVPFVVYDGSNEEAVSGAALYAFPGNLPVTLDELANGATEEFLGKWQGVFMGRTNDNGELVHTFEDGGKYLIVALKSGYLPGVGTIAVVAESVTEASGLLSS